VSVKNEQGSFVGPTEAVQLRDETHPQPARKDRCLGPSSWGGKTAVRPALGPEKVGLLDNSSRVLGRLKTWDVKPLIAVTLTWEDECGVECDTFRCHTLNDGD